jgi:hypothetical protein
MNRKKCLKTVFTGWIVLVFLLGTTACQHNIFTYNGKMVKPVNRIPIKDGGPHTSTWKTEDLTLNYKYQTHADTMSISGKITFANHIIYNYRDFTAFFLTAYFADISGMINGDQALASAGMGRQIEKVSFSRQVKLPPGAKNMVFGYQGQAVERSGGNRFGDDGSIEWEFWTTPTR